MTPEIFATAEVEVVGAVGAGAAAGIVGLTTTAGVS